MSTARVTLQSLSKQPVPNCFLVLWLIDRNQFRQTIFDHLIFGRRIDSEILSQNKGIIDLLRFDLLNDFNPIFDSPWTWRGYYTVLWHWILLFKTKPYNFIRISDPLNEAFIKTSKRLKLLIIANYHSLWFTESVLSRCLFTDSPKPSLSLADHYWHVESNA